MPRGVDEHWLFGYLLRDEWLLTYVEEQEIKVDVENSLLKNITVDIEGPLRVAAIGRIATMAGLMNDFTLGTHRMKNGRFVTCMAIASSDPDDGLGSIVPSPEQITKLKGAFDTEKDPKW
jgi:hypothetical protein